MQNFPSKFALVKLVALDLADFDRRSCGGESFVLASLFGVVYALTRRTIKPSEIISHRWLIDIINDLKIDLGSAREQHLDLNLLTILPSLKTTILSISIFYSWPECMLVKDDQNVESYIYISNCHIYVLITAYLAKLQ